MRLSPEVIAALLAAASEHVAASMVASRIDTALEIVRKVTVTRVTERMTRFGVVHETEQVSLYQARFVRVEHHPMPVYHVHIPDVSHLELAPLDEAEHV